jgi:hypothetical protein
MSTAQPLIKATFTPEKSKNMQNRTIIVGSLLIKVRAIPETPDTKKLKSAYKLRII